MSAEKQILAQKKLMGRKSPLSIETKAIAVIIDRLMAQNKHLSSKISELYVKEHAE